MATIVTRSGKGSPLTNAEVDGNFTNLNTELGTKANTSSLATVATSGAYSDLTGKPTNVSSFANDSGYITSSALSPYLTSSTAASTYQPLDGDLTAIAALAGTTGLIRKTAANTYSLDTATYLTGITSGNVTTALGFTPANKAGDTFTGAVTINSGATSQSLTLNATADTFLNFRINSADSAYVMSSAGAMYVWNRQNTAMLFGTNNVERLRIDAGGPVTASVDIRAPIFYDSNNTNYYIDPASTSNLNNLTLNTGPVYRSDWTTRFQSGSDFVDGTLVTTDIPATGFAGESFVIEITGKSYSASNLPFKVVAQGYLYNDTIINYNGISYGGDFSTYIKVFEQGGVLKFWWPRISYWNSFNVNVMAMDGPTSNTITRNRVTAIANSTEPTGTKKQQINLSRFMRGDVSATNSVDVRAPIFYDSNDTSFYVDPSTNSIMGGVFGRGQLRATGWWGSYSASGTALGIEIGQSGNRGYVLSYNRDTAAYGPMSFEATDFAFTGQGGGYAQINTSFRAPIFYDSNDTAYYIDPTSNSHLLELRIGTDAGAVNQTGVIKGGGATYGLGLFTWGDVAPIQIGGSSVTFSKEGGTGISVTSVGDFRAPIFYDSNDTAYYVDPNSTTNLNVIYGNDTYSRAWFRNINSNEGIYNQATGQHWYSDSGNFWNMGGGNLNGQGIRFRDTHNGTVRGYVYYDQSNNVGFLNSEGNWRARVVGGDYFLADGSSARAQIFYDSNDTAYYINGASDSVLNTLYLRNGSIQAKFAQASNFGYSSSYRTVVLGNEYLTTISMGVDVSGNASGSFNGQGEGREVLFRNGVTFVTPNSANTGYLPTFNMTDGYVTSGGSVRSPIFYDSDNTGYYVDPASTSVLGGIVLNGALDVRDSNPQYWRSTNGAYQRVDTRTEATSLSRAHWYGVSSSGGTSNFRHAWYDNAAYFNVTAQDGEIIFERTAGETIVRSTGSFRAPAFYDSNDTAYYIDPNGNSTVNNLYAGGGLFVLYNSVGDKVDGSPWYGMGGTTSGTVQVAGYYGLRLRTASSVVDLVGDYAQANNSFRAPIFYDSNNTAHYVDPNATSVMTTVYARKNSANNSPAIEVRGGNAGYPRIQTYGLDADANAWMGLGTDMAGGPYEHSVYFPNGAGAGRLSIGDYNGTTYNPRLWVYQGYTQINDSTRSPVFYDSNDTGYYANPNGTSVLNEIQTFGVSNIYDVSVNYEFGLFFSGGKNRDYAIYREAGAWAYPYPDLRIAFHTGIKIGAAAGYNGVRFYDNSDMLTQVMSVNNGSDALGTGNVYVNNSLQADSSVRAPIFYDSNDTFYYTNPNSNSIFYKFENINQRCSYDRAWDNYPSITVFNTTDQGPQGDFRIHGVGGVNGGDFNVRLLVDGTIQSLSDVQAPIFYDSNNTGYYINPNGTSNIYQLTGAINYGSYGSFTASGTYNGYAGIAFPDVSAALMMNQGSSGFYFNNNTWGMYCNNAGSVYAALYYDISNTAYYVDPASTTNLNVLTTAGAITAAGNITAFSDIRIKANIETIPNALDKLDQIRGVTYTRTDLDDKDQRYAGVIAQEIEAVLPEAVRDLGNIKAVDYNATIALLIQAVKELRDEVEMLRK